MEHASNKDFSEKKFDTAIELLRDNIARNDRSGFELRSGSMLPLLEVGDTVIITYTSPADLVKGDIIVYRRSRHLTVHRYIYQRVEKGVVQLRTKGDNVYFHDNYHVTPDNLIGKVISIKKKNIDLNINNAFWRSINYVFAVVSARQANSIRGYQTVKKKLFNNRNISFVYPVTGLLALPVKVLIKCILMSCRFFSVISFRRRV